MFDDLEDLIKRDLLREGYSPDYFDKMIPIRKKELAQSLYKMAEEASKQMQEENYTTLGHLRNDLKNEDLL